MSGGNGSTYIRNLVILKATIYNTECKGHKQMDQLHLSQSDACWVGQMEIPGEAYTAETTL